MHVIRSAAQNILRWPVLARLVLCLAVTGASPTWAVEEISIRLQGGTDAEWAAKRQLERLIETYEISDWFFTYDILINEKQRIPYSHPVLTVNSRYLEDDSAQLATFLHEQFHWFANDNSEQVAAAILEFQQMFPEVPSARAGGARDDYSTYLHLIVCDLEYQAMTKLIGQNMARKVLRRWKHYPWIYGQVLGNPDVRQTMESFELRIP